MLDFEEYLQQKKIDGKAFQREEPAQWREFKALFDQVHPDSFTAQKLFLINRVRRNFPLRKDEPEKQPALSSKIPPRVKPRFKPDR